MIMVKNIENAYYHALLSSLEMKICVFEDGSVRNLYPLTMTRAAFELRVGMSSLLQKVLNRMLRGLKYDEVYLEVRDYLTPVVRNRYPMYRVNEYKPIDDTLFINSRLLYTGEELEFGEEVVAMREGSIAYAYARSSTLESLKGASMGEVLQHLCRELSCKESEVRLIEWPWDLVKYNSEMLTKEFAWRGRSRVQEGIEVVGERDMVYIDPSVRVYPHVVVDCEEGPVYIDRDVRIYPYTFIQGPSYIGRGTYIMPCARIREGCSIGPVCRVGGEVEESIIHGYSNKYHDGFLGHAYVGEWVNLGAMTTNSDLKNDYTEVQVFINGKPVDTGELKVGAFIGDHAKTSIGTYLITGAVIGIMANVLAPDISPKYVPPFTWYVKGIFSRGFGLRRALRTAETMMSRRGVKLSEEERRMYEYLYEVTKRERETYIKRSRRRIMRR